MSSPHHKIKVIDGNFMLPNEAVCILLGINSNTLTMWLRSDDPPPYDKMVRGFPAKELGHWIRHNQTIRKSTGNSYPWLPKGVVLAGAVSNSGGGLPSALPSKKDYNFERTRKEAAAADKVEMENAVTRGELVSAADVEKGWANILSRVKTRIMQIPYTCAMVVVGDNDMASVQSKIKDAVKDALMELSADWRDIEHKDDD